MVVSIAGGVTTIVGRTVSKNMIEKEIHNHLETAARSRAHHIETFLKTEKEAIKQLSESVVIERFLLAGKQNPNYSQKRDDVRRRLEYTARIGEFTYDIIVLDGDGIIAASSDEDDIGKDKSDDPYFLGGKRGVFIKDAYVSSHKQRRTLAFATPLFDEEAANFLGVVVIRISTERLNEITMDRTGLGETGEIYLVNKDGYMITPSRFISDTFLKRKIETKNMRDCFRDVEYPGAQEREHKVILCRNYLGMDIMGIHAHIPEMEWCVLAEISAKEAFAPVARFTHMTLSVFAVLLIGGVMFSVVLSGTLTKAIVKLHHGTEEIERGNLDYKVGTQAKDEIGQLSRAFDNMTDQLKKSKEELEEYSKGLEEKVEKRTAQLKEQFARSEKQRMAMLNISQDLEETNNNLQAEITERKKA
ncbi:HAMP domain-containing protein, partial [bacterium]|nr:HAMP domain-containing protein [bacterium]